MREINLSSSGDFIAEGDDVFGDRVNVAACLEALAEPGVIRVSRVVPNQIRDRLPYPFEDLGEQAVKNIASRACIRPAPRKHRPRSRHIRFRDSRSDQNRLTRSRHAIDLSVRLNKKISHQIA